MPSPSDRAATQTSFRDPSGSLILTPTRALRAVNAHGRAELEAVMASAAWREMHDSGDVVPTRVIAYDDQSATPIRGLLPAPPALLLEHDRIRFPSYPYEWPAEMLHAAGQLTIRIAQRLLDDGFGLKDATPFNVLFQGPRPVFIDVLSLEPRRPGDSIWLAQAQFARTFVLPLLLRNRLGAPPHLHFLATREGLAPEDVYALVSRFLLITPPFLSWVTLPTLMGRAAEKPGRTRVAPAPAKPQDPEKARFVLRFLFRRHERVLASVAPRDRRHSTWSEYEACTHYDRQAAEAKETFVASSLDRVSPRHVLDIGCNVGRFSRLAATRGASVVAVDLDPVVVGQVWQMATRERLDILPLVQNLGMPSPATGWWNRECPSFIDRAAGKFDMLLMLALVHHLLVTDRIPLDQIVELAAHLSTGAAIVEYVGPEDPMFRRIARGREHLHADLAPQTFEQAWNRRFRTARAEPVPGTGRILYLFEKHPG